MSSTPSANAFDVQSKESHPWPSARSSQFSPRRVNSKVGSQIIGTMTACPVDERQSLGGGKQRAAIVGRVRAGSLAANLPAKTRSGELDGLLRE